MNTEAVWDFLEAQGVDFGLKVLGAIVLWRCARWEAGIRPGGRDQADGALCS